MEKVKKTGVLVAGVTDDAPPFSFMEKDSGRIVGHDVDFVTALAAKLGARVELRAVTGRNRLSELIDGNIDILAANLTHSQSHARESVIDLSDHYLGIGQKFLAKRGTIKTLKDLWGKKIGAVVGTASLGCASDRCEGGTIVPVDDYVQGVRALQRGDIDAFTSDQVILVELLASLPLGDYEIPELQISEEQYHLGVRKGDSAFLDFVNKAIRDMQQSGEAKTLKDKWFEPRTEGRGEAYGAVLRRASARPRFLGVLLKGVLAPKAEVSIFSLDGTYLGKGNVVNVADDEFYVDVDEKQYDLVRSGFLVTMDMSNEMARDVVIRHQELLRSVRADAEKEAERIRAEIEKEAIAKQQRAHEIDMLRERSKLTVQEERALFFRGYRGYR
ncbi:MAG: transporter substrate-binding domain-containing protein [Deltaproteobacteria bacterium]|nr:transporter substrate-binding domain-containing protein [Deltaproteobacteria bacterium]